jgi:hypothetical protein
LEAIFMNLITKEWMEDQLLKLELDLAGAERREAKAKTRLDEAKAGYAAARKEAAEASGLILYFRRELENRRLNEDLMEEAEAGE